LGLNECIQLLQQNLQQEMNASQKLSMLAHQYSQPQQQSPQDAIPAVPVANSANGMANQPMPNPQTALPTQPDLNANPYMQQAQQKGTTTPQPAMNPTSQIQAGMPVVGSDMSNIGLVKEVRDNDFLVDIPMQRDRYVPFTAVQNVEADQVVLEIKGSQVNEMDWAKPSLL
jgi:hypothetical protein